MFIFTLAAVLIWMATIRGIIHSYGSPAAAAAPGRGARVRWLFVGALLLPAAAFGAAVIAALSSSPLRLGGL
jgi:hypothetical protein